MLRGRALKVGMWVAVLGLLAWSSPAARAAGKADVMKALQTLQNEVKSYSANGQSKFTMRERTFEQTLTVVAKASGKYKETTKSERMGTQTERATTCDGKTVWLPAGRDGQIRSIDRAAVAKALGIQDVKSVYLPRDPIDLANPFLALSADTIKYIGQEKMGDTDVHVFEGQAKWPAMRRREAEPFWPRQKLMISAKDGLLRSVTTLDREGAESRVLTYTDVKINPPVADDVFAFKAPEGAAVEDATQATIDQMKEAMAAAKKP